MGWGLCHISKNSLEFKGEQGTPQQCVVISGVCDQSQTVSFHLSGRVDKEGTEADEKKPKVSQKTNPGVTPVPVPGSSPALLFAS